MNTSWHTSTCASQDKLRTAPCNCIGVIFGISHTERAACGGKVLLKADGAAGTIIEIVGSRLSPVHDPRPLVEVANSLRRQGLDVTIW